MMIFVWPYRSSYSFMSLGGVLWCISGLNLRLENSVWLINLPRQLSAVVKT
jgi:hypothetical protein